MRCLYCVDRISRCCVGLVGLLFGCKSAAVAPVPVPVADIAAIPDDARIAIRRSVCFGSCPDYDLEIRGDGQVTFAGYSYVRFRDRRTKRVSRAAVANLFAEFQRAGYFSWKDKYETEATDMPTVTTWVTVAARAKKITDYGPTPLLPSDPDRTVREKLTALEDRVDAVAGSDEWVRCPDGEDGRCRFQ